MILQSYWCNDLTTSKMYKLAVCEVFFLHNVFPVLVIVIVFFHVFFSFLFLVFYLGRASVRMSVGG